VLTVCVAFMILAPPQICSIFSLAARQHEECAPGEYKHNCIGTCVPLPTLPCSMCIWRWGPHVVGGGLPSLMAVWLGRGSTACTLAEEGVGPWQGAPNVRVGGGTWSGL
jgi:hypothetical protein